MVFAAVAAIAVGACQPPPDSGGEPALFECGGTETDDPALLDALAFVRGYLADVDVPGAAFAIVEDGQLTQVGVAGSKKSTVCAPITPDTRFFTFFTQHLTDALVHDAIAAGDLSLDDAFVDYAPEFTASPPTAGDPADVTIEHLLSNTSGLSVAATRSCLDTAAWLRAFGELPLWAPGGRIHQIQPIGASFAALAVERATGTAFRDALADRVTGPLGMNGTFIRLDALKGDMATGYQQGNDGLISVPIDLESCGVSDPYLGYFASATDGGAFLEYLLEPDNPLLADAGEAFIAPERVTRGHMIRAELDDGTEWVYANIRSSGYGYDIRVVPAHGFGVAVFLNGVHGDPEDIAERIVRIYTGARPVAPESPDPATFGSLVGTYRDLAGTVLLVGIEDGDLTVQIDGGTVFPLVPARHDLRIAPDLFEVEIGEGDTHQLRFWRGTEGAGEVISENAGRNSLGTPFYRVE